MVGWEGTVQAVVVWLLAAGAGFSFIWAFAILVSRRGYREQVTLAGIVFLAGVWQASGAYVSSGLARTFPLFLGWQNPALFLLGPLIYRFYVRALLLQEASWRRAPIHLLPAVLCLAAMAPYFGAAEAEKVARLMGDLRDSYSPIIWACNVGPKVSILAYLSLVSAQLLRSVIPGPANAARQLLALKLLSIYVALFAGFIGFVVGSQALVQASAAALPLIVFVSFVLSEAVPDMFAEIGRRARTYDRSRLGGVAIEEVRAELQRLMAEERVYLDEDLSLSRLAQDVGLSAHQLSEFLNRHMGRSFAEFVSDYRVREARALLLNEPGRSILSVAHAAGFNSKSAFYRAFRRATGRDPSEYRRDSPPSVPGMIRERSAGPRL